MKKDKIKPMPKTKLGAMIIDKFNKEDLNYQEIGIDCDHWCKWDSNKRSWWIIATKSYTGTGSLHIWCCRNKGMGSEKEINYSKLKDEEKIAIQKYLENAKLHTKQSHFEASKSYPDMKAHDYEARWFTSSEPFPDLESYLPESWHQPNPSWAQNK